MLPLAMHFGTYSISFLGYTKREAVAGIKLPSTSLNVVDPFSRPRNSGASLPNMFALKLRSAYVLD